MKSIEELRKVLKSCTNEAGIEPNKFDTYWITADACDHLIDEIEAEIERDYMPKPKIEKCFNAINSGITDISEALQNIAECNAAKCAMRQEITHADVETMIGSIAAIADAYYMRLPVDADGVPIHLYDKLLKSTGAAEPTYGEVVGISDDSVFFNAKQGWESNWSKLTRHVKPRTLEDVLEDCINEFSHRCTEGKYDTRPTVAKYADEIRELLGGDM